MPIVYVSIFLNAAGPQNVRNVLSENLILPTPRPPQETRAVVLACLLVGTPSRRKKTRLRACLRIILYNKSSLGGYWELTSSVAQMRADRR